MNFSKRIEERRRREASYTPKVWAEAKAVLWSASFPEELFSRLISTPAVSPKGNKSHSIDGESHTLQSYAYPAVIKSFDVFWEYDFCPQCRNLVGKRAVLLNDIENVALIRDFLKVSARRKDPIDELDGRVVENLPLYQK